MAHLTHLSITALKDNVFIETKRSSVPSVSMPGTPVLDDAKSDEGKSDDEKKAAATQVEGITLRKDQEVEIDVRDYQLPAFQAAVDAGDLEIQGMPAGVVAATNTSSSAPNAKRATAPAGSDKGGPVSDISSTSKATK